MGLSSREASRATLTFPDKRPVRLERLLLSVESGTRNKQSSLRKQVQSRIDVCAAEAAASSFSSGICLQKKSITDEHRALNDKTVCVKGARA